MGLCVAFIALVRLPSLKVSTLLLIGLLVYDVFWVSLWGKNPHLWIIWFLDVAIVLGFLFFIHIQHQCHDEGCNSASWKSSRETGLLFFVFSFYNFAALPLSAKCLFGFHWIILFFNRLEFCPRSLIYFPWQVKRQSYLCQGS